MATLKKKLISEYDSEMQFYWMRGDRIILYVRRFCSAPEAGN